MSEGQGGSPAQSAAPVESAAPVDSNTSENQSQQNSAPQGEVSAEAIQDAVDNGEISEKEAQKLIKKFDLKIKGKTVSREYDLSDDKFLRDQFQLAEVSKMSMQEVADIKKAYAKEMERWKQSPEDVMRELGLDPDEWSEKRIEKRIEEMKKSPEQLEKEKYQKELEEARREAKQLREQKEQAEMSKLQQEAAIQIESEIVDALNGHRTLPNSPYVVKKIADTMLWAIGQGHSDITAADVVPLVEREMQEELSRLYDEMPEEALERFIGKKNIERMRKKRLSSAKVPSLNDIKQTSASVKPPEPAKPSQKVLAKDFFRNKK